ncbi:TadE family protein [metagenome]|uniref:TadE family protein n=1 Tax=metagenome TaxID=256318 RepID=A0A2P2CF19_9ZZZZ
MVLPLLVSLTIALVWVLSLGVAQVRAVDAARETARSIARGDDESVAVGLGRQVAPEGASITVSRAGGRVSVVVDARVGGPGGLVERFGGVTVSAEAVSAQEDQ